MALFSLKDVTIGYQNKKVLENLSFEVNTGDYLCIVGENGTGKSTLMKTILGLTPVLSGEIVLGDGLKRNEIGYLPQQTIVQRDFPATVKEIVISGCLSKCGIFYTKEQKNLAKYQMQRLGILDLANKCYRHLSGGQQQRVLLARALCATSKILLLDEPVSGLDPKVTAELYEIIQKINNNDSITIIMISHDISAAKKYASHILHLKNNSFSYSVNESEGADNVFFFFNVF